MKTYRIDDLGIHVRGESDDKESVNMLIVEKEGFLLPFGNLATLCRSIPDLGVSVHTLYREDLNIPYKTKMGYTIRRASLIQGNRDYGNREYKGRRKKQERNG